MDLYKHAFRLTPMLPSELVADCFELARDIRVLDMRASPYDLADLGLDPVRIETPEGKREYAAAQRAFAERARPLRERLIGWTHRLVRETDDVPQRTSIHTSRWSEVGNGKLPVSRKSGSSVVGQNTPEPVTRIRRAGST
jgi:hypothetical protein